MTLHLKHHHHHHHQVSLSFTSKHLSFDTSIKSSSGETVRKLLFWKVPSWLGSVSLSSTYSCRSSPFFCQEMCTALGKKPVA
ncbi:hypothetical protein MHYP_G00262030 [Metynnis hypsauchen]